MEGIAPELCHAHGIANQVVEQVWLATLNFSRSGVTVWIPEKVDNDRRLLLCGVAVEKFDSYLATRLSKYQTTQFILGFERVLFNISTRLYAICGPRNLVSVKMQGKIFSNSGSEQSLPQ